MKHFLTDFKKGGDMPVPEFLSTPLPLSAVASQYWDLRAFPTQYFFSLLALAAEDKLERDKCIEFSSPGGQEDWLNYSRRPKRTPLEVLHDFHRTASKLTIELLFELFSTIKPRSFSIAGSAAGSLDVLVAVVSYRTVIKQPRLGLGSNWLKGLAPGDRVYGWIKAGTFKFPPDGVPLIMVGPGTGLAPFRSLLQQRGERGELNSTTHHLFFGCRRRDADFHCGSELAALAERGQLTLYCAFSRDQDRKVYVQHKIAEHAETLRPLIEEQNAHIFVSGNAKDMPDGVRAAFAAVCGAEDPAAFAEELRRKGRYQEETW